MDYEQITEKEIGEEVKFTFDKKASESERIYYPKCRVKTKKIEIEMSMPPLSIRLNVFRCPKCNKEYLNLKKSEKLDQLLIIKNIIEERGISYERAVNFDKDNFFVRFPAELTKGLNKKSKAKIRPISMNKFLIEIEKA